MERVWKTLPLYLLLGLPAGYACIATLGYGWGVVVGCIANITLWHILLRPVKEESDDSN